jgi:hypothetical protein
MNFDQKFSLGSIVFKRCLNFVFLDLFKDQYEQLGLSSLDRTIAAQFIYEVIMTTNSEYVHSHRKINKIFIQEF